MSSELKEIYHALKQGQALVVATIISHSGSNPENLRIKDACI